MRLPRLRHPVVSYRRARIMPRWVRRVDRAANRRINASRSWHLHDRGYSRLSHAADRGVLWYAIAATLLVLGYRRAALRGVASMVVSGVMADVVVKRFFDGRRPVFTEVPTIRRLRAYPDDTFVPLGALGERRGIRHRRCPGDHSGGRDHRAARRRGGILPDARGRPLAL